jgi:hypothetical protein
MPLLLRLEQVQYAVVDGPTPEADDALLFQDPGSGIVVEVPMNKETRERMTKMLRGEKQADLVVASGLPGMPDGPPLNREQRRAAKKGRS